MKEYSVSDLFHTSWSDITPKKQAEVYALKQAAKIGDPQYGYILIEILKRLNKNPHLVDKINEEQAVDIYNDLKFLEEPWYYFPELPNKSLALVKPDQKMARCSFDQFIYADNEFSSFVINQDRKHLGRLVVTLYPLLGDEFFDPECVEERERILKLHDWQLNLVFFTFAHIRELVMARCKTLLPKTKPTEDSKPSSTGPMWHNIKHNAARTHTFGTFEATGRANMYSVLDHLEILCKEKPHGKS